MAEICCDILSESGKSAPCRPSSRAARRRRMELRRFKVITGLAPSMVPDSFRCKRQKVEAPLPILGEPRECDNTVESSASAEKGKGVEKDGGRKDTLDRNSATSDTTSSTSEAFPKYGVASFIGRRRDMEDAISVQPFFCRRDRSAAGLRFFGVFDGHGCSHVAMCCKDEMHKLVAEELERGRGGDAWREVMERSFLRMDRQAATGGNTTQKEANCRCELQTPHCDAVGSTAVVAVISPDSIVVANCGDSRAVLCRDGKAIPLSSDHKPDRPDELQRIQAAGGRVIYWDGPRVLGVLAMSRSIGDYYLKPYVSSVPEVTVTQRSEEDECLILASDGLWDVVANDTACEVARMCLRGRAAEGGESGGSDKACRDAAMLLTKLAFARQSQDNVSVVVVDLRRNTYKKA